MTAMDIYNDSRTVSRADLAAWLRQLADQLDSDGHIYFGAAGRVAVADRVECELEIERESGTELSVEIEFTWTSAAAGAGAGADEEDEDEAEDDEGDAGKAEGSVPAGGDREPVARTEPAAAVTESEPATAPDSGGGPGGEA
jgi:amphi-Trp domain-containing protein